MDDKRLIIKLPDDLYSNIKSKSEELHIPMTTLVKAIISLYLRSEKENGENIL